MIPEHIKNSVSEALALLPPQMASVVAVVQLYAMGLQESKFIHRWQVVDAKSPERKGPARGFWQFERGGGVRGVMMHPSTKEHAQKVCEALAVQFDEHVIWEAMEQDDVLAAAFARLLLWADPKPLPPLGSPELAWQCYVSAWRPGKPHRSTWNAYYSAAMLAADRRRDKRV